MRQKNIPHHFCCEEEMGLVRPATFTASFLLPDGIPLPQGLSQKKHQEK
jgi:hypothetical protein